MLKQTKELLEQRSHSAEVYYAANDISYVRPIFSVIWAPTHAAFSPTAGLPRGWVVTPESSSFAGAIQYLHHMRQMNQTAFAVTSLFLVVAPPPPPLPPTTTHLTTRFFFSHWHTGI